MKQSNYISRWRRVVIKIGSNVLTRDDDHALDVSRLAEIVDQVARLRQAGIETVIVSSGAVSSGRGELRHYPMPELGEVEERQLCAAVGQTRLMGRYYDFFREYDMHVGQVLTTKENFADRQHCDNQERCMRAMLQAGVIPIVNENDTVSVTELMFTDNDELSGLVAQMVGADALVILSNIDGLYDGDPANPESKIIPEVAPGRNVEEYIQAKRSSAGRGGMVSKCATAQRLAAEGIDVLIANGKRPSILLDLLLPTSGNTVVPHTHFKSK
ncbi:MAG: glutamate 5-kinase [Bacteroidales bacterium]|nr:glutamate 5-kinase [Bacteroidales bacterium]